MVSCPNNPSRMLSPRPAIGGGLRGVAKHPAAPSRFATTKTKKVQRALCTLFEESAVKSSSPFFSVKGWLASPGSRLQRRNIIKHPALGRLRMQEIMDAPVLRKATPIKDRQMTLLGAFGRHRMQGDLDALADELGTCQLQSALKTGPMQAPLGQTPAIGDMLPMALMRED